MTNHLQANWLTTGQKYLFWLSKVLCALVYIDICKKNEITPTTVQERSLKPFLGVREELRQQFITDVNGNFYSLDTPVLASS